MYRFINGHIFFAIHFNNIIPSWLLKSNKCKWIKERAKKFQLQQQADSLRWREIKSVEDLWSSYPDRIKFLMEKLYLKRPGLIKVERAMQTEDTIAVAKALLTYYPKSESGFWLRNPPLDSVSDTDFIKANLILRNTVSYTGVPLTVSHHERKG